VVRYTRYPSEFKDDAIALVNSSGRSIAEVARSLGMSSRTLWYWVSEDRKIREHEADPTALNADEAAELNRLRKENAQQKEDMEILRKAAAAGPAAASSATTKPSTP
jgi:transposase